MEEMENQFGMNTANIETDLMDIKENARIKQVIGKLKLYSENPKELTDLYTEILLDDNVSFMIKKISQDPIFYRHFPEFYEKNEYEENVINCQQNSSYHKYGVFRHILTTVEAVGNPQIPIGDKEKRILKWTMLLHDIGKPYVKTISPDGGESFAGHDEKSVELATGILDRLYFSDEDKHIILTLIKYHDQFLNEGEITYDNMKFLANELDDNKELFYLLIDVKDSDAMAKSLEVYNKYKITKNKYIEFINTYFANTSENEIQVKSTENDDNTQTQQEEMSRVELDNLVADVISRKRVIANYQPIIDLKNKEVMGYEVFTKIESNKKIDIVKFLNYAKDSGNYDKVQQVMLVNGIDEFEKVTIKESKKLFVNTDLESYEKYVNKPRLYDMMSRNQIVVEIHNYEKRDLTKIQEIISTIHKNRGFVALDNFGVGTLTIDEIGFLNADYIIPDMSLIKNIEQDENKQKYLSDLVTFSVSNESSIIVVGVETKEVMEAVQKLGVRFVQGYYFEKPKPEIEMENEKLKKLLTDSSNDSVL